MNYDELKASKNMLVASGDKSTALKYLEKMVPLCSDMNELKDIMLELAELFFENGSFEKASKMYHEFTLLYPGSNDVERAMYRAIASTFQLTLDAEHDQTKTCETLELAEEFMKHSLFATFREEVASIISLCHQRLFESEALIFNFYINCGNRTAAQKRLATMKETYLSRNIPDVSLKLATLETALGVTAALDRSEGAGDRGAKTVIL